MLARTRQLGHVPGAQMFTEEFLREDSIHVIADPVWCEASERRYYIMHFLHQAARHFPEEKKALKALEDQFWTACDIMGNTKRGYISKIGDNPVNMQKLAKDLRGQKWPGACGNSGRRTPKGSGCSSSCWGAWAPGKKANNRCHIQEIIESLTPFPCFRRLSWQGR